MNYSLFEWVELWRPIVDSVSSLTNVPINYCHADIRLPLLDAENKAISSMVSNTKKSFLFVFSFVALESLFCPRIVAGKNIFAENLLQGLLDLFFGAGQENNFGKVVFLIVDAGAGKSQDRLSGSLMAIDSFVKIGKEEGRFHAGLVCEVTKPDRKNLALVIHNPV